MPSIVNRDRTWLTEHEDLVEWLESFVQGNPEGYAVLSFLNDWLTNHLTLTAQQTEIAIGLRRDLEAGQTARARSIAVHTVRVVHGYDPASAGDMSNIFNGHYAVNTRDGAEFGFQIYTATRGQLQGQRLVKYMDPGSGRWIAFATILRNGDFHLWRRFQEDTDAPWVIAAMTMVGQLQTEEPAERAFNTRHYRGNLNIVVNASCRYCNQEITDAVESNLGIHGRCHAMLMPVPVRPAPMAAREWDDDEPITDAEQRAIEDRTCPVCSAVLRTPNFRNAHLGVSHPEYRETQEEGDDEVAVFPCTQCEHESNTQGELWTHQRTEHPDYYSYVCSRCERPFHEIGQRSTHRRVEHPITRPSRTPRRNITPAQPTATRQHRVNMSEIDPTWPQ